MPRDLVRIQQSRELHFITFSCYHHAPLLATPEARKLFEITLERVRRWYGFFIVGYVVMPDHVHLLMSEPERGSLAVVVQMLKQIVSRGLHRKPHPSAKSAERVGHPLPSHPSAKSAERVGHPNAPFWQRRYYDFNVWSYRKEVEKLRYLHRNPVRRGLVERPEDWEWSSFRHHATGEEGVVEIESRWTARKRERAWEVLKVKVRRA